MTAEPVVLSWSGGKDSALALARLREDPRIEVVGLVTAVTAGAERVSVHGVRRTLLQAQAGAVGLPVHEVTLEPRGSNSSYERAWREALARLQQHLPGARRLAYGDIFLADVREYREGLARSLGFGSLFPLWGESTRVLAEEVLERRIRARLVCVDAEVLSSEHAGRAYDAALLEELPPGIDPCGERGEFHTFVSAGPGFRSPVRYRLGELIREERFAFRDLLPDPGGGARAAPGSPITGTRVPD